MRVTFGDAKSSVVLSDDLREYVLQTVRRVGGAVVEKLEAAAVELEEHARNGWPVGLRNRPRSRDQFVRELRISSNVNVSAILKNTAPYAYMIKSAKLYPQQVSAAVNPHAPKTAKRLHAYSELVRKPAIVIADKLVTELGPAAVAAIGRR